MKTSDFNYDLDEKFIAQHPILPRDHAKLMLVSRDSMNIQHKIFYDILDELKRGDLLVVNDTRVRPA